MHCADGVVDGTWAHRVAHCRNADSPYKLHGIGYILEVDPSLDWGIDEPDQFEIDFQAAKAAAESVAELREIGKSLGWDWSVTDLAVDLKFGRWQGWGPGGLEEAAEFNEAVAYAEKAQADPTWVDWIVAFNNANRAAPGKRVSWWQLPDNPKIDGRTPSHPDEEKIDGRSSRSDRQAASQREVDALAAAIDAAIAAQAAAFRPASRPTAASKKAPTMPDHAYPTEALVLEASQASYASYDDNDSDKGKASREIAKIAAPKRRKVRNEADQTASPTNGPVVRIVAGELHNSTTAAEDALIASSIPIFQRGDSLTPLIQRMAGIRWRM